MLLMVPDYEKKPNIETTSLLLALLLFWQNNIETSWSIKTHQLVCLEYFSPNPDTLYDQIN